MYQTGYAMPMPGYALAPSRSGAWGDYFRGFSLALWLFMLIVSFWWLQKWDDIYAVRETGWDKNIQYAAFIVAFVAHLSLGISTIIELSIRFWGSVKGRLLGGFCLLMLATAPLGLDPLRSALYALATLGVLMTCYWAWEIDYDRFRRSMLIAAILLLGYLFVLTFHHGMGMSSVGGIQRNKFGQAAFTGAICLFLYRGKIKWAGIAICLGYAVLVNSRGTMLATALFVASYLALKFGVGRSILGVLGMVMIGVILMTVPKFGQRMQDALLQRVARVNEAGRGIGSGLSGRLETWQHGVDAFKQSPAIGHGFRTRVPGHPPGPSYSPHSGYVAMLADAGLAGAAMILGAIIYDFIKRFRAIGVVRREYGGDGVPPDLIDTFELNCVICSFMVAEAELWLIEPLYLNLGSCLSILFILLIMAPQTVGRLAQYPAWASSATRYWPYQHPAEGWA
jgi:hypothetical protein